VYIITVITAVPASPAVIAPSTFTCESPFSKK
jgi:hypothetical protein